MNHWLFFLMIFTGSAFAQSNEPTATSNPPNNQLALGPGNTANMRPALELKGIKLGDDLATVQAAMPEADCEILSEHPSLGECFQSKGGSIGGKPAQYLVRLLDGRVVYIVVTKLTQEDAFAVGDALKGKYGEPDWMGKTRVTLVRPSQDRSIAYMVPVWADDNKNQILTVQPANYTSKREQFTYAAVSLVDKNGHDAVWMSRKRGGMAGGANANDL